MTKANPLAYSHIINRPARFEHNRATPTETDELFARLCAAALARGLSCRGDLSAWLTAAGIDPAMPCLSGLAEWLADADAAIEPGSMQAGFGAETAHDLTALLTEDLAVPEFVDFSNRLANIFGYVSEFSGGKVASYIPELAKQDHNAFGMAVCSIDGQRFDLGDAATSFCLQSVIKPLNYALALGLNGDRTVHRHVGREPSGQRFNELALDTDFRPHNPMINSGAIMCCALMRPSWPVADRLELIRRFWNSAAGGDVCGFDAEVYRSESQTAERNRELVRLMQEHDAFPEGTDTDTALDLYFRSCSLTLDCRSLAVVAATLANGGVCPLTGHRIADSTVIRNTLSLMLSCGMYDFSGEFAFSVGVPAKSGVSGGLILVIPGVCGIALWSPPLDRHGNPVRGLEFSRRLVESFPFHVFSGVSSG